MVGLIRCSRPGLVSDYVFRSGRSVAIAQTKPASSRAQATTIFWWGLPAGHPLPALVEALLAAPGVLEHERVLAAGEFVADGATSAPMPGRFDEQPSHVAVADLGDRALPALLTQ